MQLTLEAPASSVDETEPTPLADMIMDMLLAKKRAGDRKAWLEEKGDQAVV